MKVLKIQNSALTLGDLRLDSKFHLNDGLFAKLELSKSPYRLDPLGSVTNRIFNGARFKRRYVAKSENGVPFMGSADMMNENLSGLKLISNTLTKNLNDLILDKDWILVSCSGTIGNTVYTNTEFAGKAASQHVMRIVPNKNILPGFLYAFLSSKYGHALLTSGTYGGVIQHIEPEHIHNLSIPRFPDSLQKKVNDLITECSSLRIEANSLLKKADKKLMNSTGLKALSQEQYDFFGISASNRQSSLYIISSEKLSKVSLNAFNYSERIRNLVKYIKKTCETNTLHDCLSEEQFFTTGAFPRLEIDSPKSIKLINQSDIFSIKKKGKMIARRKVSTDNLVKYGEVLIAAVGTLGENETFCRVVFANEELKDQLISGEFIRMNTNERVPPGYLFTWLSSDYGFRLIRSTQTGTKLCRPIQSLLYQIPVPIIDRRTMNSIDDLVRTAHTNRWKAIKNEQRAISIIENEISSWQK